MVKAIKHNKIGKRMLALLLALLTVLSCFMMFPMSGYASKITYAGHELHFHNGKDVYCIEYGKISDAEFKKDADAVSYYNNLSSSKRNKINNIIRSASVLGYVNSGDNAKFGAVQKAIWEVMGDSTTWNSRVNEYYKTLKDATEDFTVDITTDYIPSFVGETYNLTVGKDQTIKDTNGVYTDHWSVSKKNLDGKATVTTGSADDTLVLNAIEKIDYADRVSFEITSDFRVAEKITKSNANDYVGKMGSQNVIMAPDLNFITRTISLYAYEDVKLGTIVLYKVDDEGNRLSGVQFTCMDKDGNTYPYKAEYFDGTDSRGKVAFNNLPVSGNPYTIHEVEAPDGYYIPVNDVQINVVEDEIVKIGNDGTNTWWINNSLRGNLIIQKYFENSTLPYAGATFNLTDGENTFTGQTSANGYLEFNNVKSGWYTLYEDPNNANVIGWNHGDAYIWNGTGYDVVKEYNYGCSVYIPASDTIYFTNNNAIINYSKRGDLRVHKNVETTNGYQNGSGFEITITSNASDNALGQYLQFTEHTGADGYAYFCDLPVGTYTVKETSLDTNKYIQPADQTVQIVWDGNYTYAVTGASYTNNSAYFNANGAERYIEFYNTLKRGDLRIHKTEEIPGDDYKGGQYQNGSGFEFTVISNAANNILGVDLQYTVKTDADGYAYFCDLPLGTYTIKETNLDSKYVQPEDQTAQIVWDGNTVYDVTGTAFRNSSVYFNVNGAEKYFEFVNYLKMFRVNVEKDDSEFADRAQGDASLAGAVYELYKGTQLVGTYVTDINGSFTTDYFICDNDYVLKEKTASEGYLIDVNEHSITEGSDKYTLRFNDTNMTVYEDVKKGKIEIIKFKDDNNQTGIKEPEVNAQFQIWLKSAGSYDKAYETERDILTTDADGHAITKDLPYGTYVVHQTKGTEGFEFISDFEVFIDTDGKVYKYLLQNNVDQLYLKVVKVDSETGEVIPYDELQGAMFQILDSNGKVMSFKYTYPYVTTIDTFTINSEGYLMLPEKLNYGKYYLVEVQAPYGYYNPNFNYNDPKIDVEIDQDGNATYKYDFNEVNKIPFNISSTDEKTDTIITGSDIEIEVKYVTVEVENQPQKGRINVTKQGEVFASVTELNGIYTPTYSIQGLEGAQYNIIADEEITTPDGTVRYHKDEIVDTITTGKNGVATSKELYLGKYRVEEIKAPHGYVNENEAQTIELTYQGQEYDVFDISTTFSNERQKCEITGDKTIEVDKLYEIGNNDEITSICFGLYAAEKMTASDGKIIPKDGLIETVYVTSDGEITFTADLPVDYTYYVKEIATDEHYILSNEKYMINFTYQGEDVEIVNIQINGGKAIHNEIIRGDIVGHKVDETGRDLSGAKFGLFACDETKFTEKNAFLVAVSSKDGHFEFRDVPYGNYIIKELSAPDNYIYSEDPIEIKITEDEQEIDLGDIENILAKGVIEIEKTGEVFSSVTENVDGTYSPVYTTEHLEGVTFDVIAAEDIYTYFGDKVVSKGDVVDTITTDENGIAKTTELYFGKYYIVEKETLDGFVLDESKHEVDLAYVDNDTPIVTETLTINNTRQKAEISLTKEMEKDSIFNIGDNGEIANVVFGLFADEDMTALDGSIIEKDSMLEMAKTDENGKLTFSTDIPYGYKYYVKEIATDKHYSLFNDEFNFTFTADDNSASIVEIQINDGKVVMNELLRGKVTGYKFDENNNPLAGATFGLFYADETEFTDDNAILTAISDANGMFYMEYIDYGDYVVREIKAPEGYVLNTTSFPVSITKHEQEVIVESINQVIRASIVVNKVDSEYPENTLSGAVFAVYEDTNRNGIFDDKNVEYGRLAEVSKGVYRMDNIPYGYYLVKEVSAPTGFTIDENYYSVFISENGAEYQIMNNGVCFIDNAATGSLKIIKTSSDKNVEGFEFLIEGVSDSGVPVSMIVQTDKNGEINVSPLRTGTYTVKEIENDLTDRYVLPEAQTITITDGQTAELSFYNKVKEGKIIITKTDVSTGKVIPNCKIEILDEDGNVVVRGITDENGVVEFTLEYGKYYYREYDAPEGYILDETPYAFEITEDGQIIEAVMTNEAEVEETSEVSPKTGTQIMAVVAILLISSAALGTLLLYSKKRKKSTTD